jgi:peptidoglycan hydrolase-like protein with peptidoglycan-binding domain
MGSPGTGINRRTPFWMLAMVLVFTALIGCQETTLPDLIVPGRTFGEGNLHNFNADFGKDIPSSPRYSLHLGKSDRHYVIDVHQGTPIMNTAGYVRFGHLRRAGAIVAEITCRDKGLKLQSKSFRQEGGETWVHAVGDFVCASGRSDEGIIDPDINQRVELTNGGVVGLKFGPSEGSQRLAWIGGSAVVLGYVDDGAWVHVQSGKLTGYIPSTSLKMVPRVNVEERKGLRSGKAAARQEISEGYCYRNPSAAMTWASRKQCKIDGGVILKNTYEYARCQERKLGSFACSVLLGRASSSVAATSNQDTGRSKTLYVRPFPGGSAAVIARLTPDQKFTIERQSPDGWSYIKFENGRRGYLPTESIPVVSRLYQTNIKAKNREKEAKIKTAHKEAEEKVLAENRKMYLLQAQTALKSLGLYKGNADGIAGANTRAALTRWLKQHGYNKGAELTDAIVARMRIQAETETARRAKLAKTKQNKALALSRQAHKYAVAVIVGNRDYAGRTPDVEYAGNDADAIRNFVIDNLRYRPGNVIDLRDATLSELNATFGTANNHKGRLFDYVRAGKSDVIVFYSGHGVPGLKDRKGYLLPVNADPNRAELNGYPLDVLLANLAQVPARSMAVYIDACFSGESQKGMLVQATSGITVQAKVPNSSKGMVVVTAAQNDQFASWDEDAKHGLFTKHLLEALRGKADGDGYGNGDGKVTLSELKLYLDEEMTYQARRRWSRDQNASVQGSDSAVLATLK